MCQIEIIFCLKYFIIYIILPLVSYIWNVIIIVQNVLVEGRYKTFCAT